MVVDDVPEHAQAITDCIQSLGASCATVIYTAEHDPPPSLFRGARVVFMDLQLVNKAAGDFNMHFAVIQQILTKSIKQSGGTFLLVLWTDEPSRVNELKTYLQKNMYERNPHARPVDICALSKTDFMTGDPNAPKALATELQKLIAKTPSISALMNWESEIVVAADKVLNSIVDLGDSDGTGLGTLLKHIAIETTGNEIATSSPRTALHQAFLPLLSDQIVFDTEPQAESLDPWNNAYDGAAEKLDRLERAKAAKLNTRLHLRSMQNNRDVKSISWGAICRLEDNFPWSDFDVDNEADFIKNYVEKKISLDWMKKTDPINGKKTCNHASDSAIYAQIKILQIRIDAACDFAQFTGGPIPYVLAAFIPANPAAEGRALKLRDNATAWLSPVLDVPNLCEEPESARGNLLVIHRFTRNRGIKQAEKLQVVACMKEQLLSQLIASISYHGSRLGITRIDG